MKVIKVLIKNNNHLKKVINESIKYLLKEDEGDVSNINIDSNLGAGLKEIPDENNLNNQKEIVKNNNIILSFVLNLFDRGVDFDDNFYKSIGVVKQIQDKAKEIDEEKIKNILKEWSEKLVKINNVKEFNKLNTTLKNKLNKIFISWEPLLIISLNSKNFINFIKENIDDISFNQITIGEATVEMPDDNSILGIINTSSFQNFIIENKLDNFEKQKIYTQDMKMQSEDFINEKWSTSSSISWIKNMLTGAATFLFGEEDAKFVNDIFDGIDELASSGIEKNIDLVKGLEKSGDIKGVLNHFMKNQTPGKDAIEKVLYGVQRIVNGEDNEVEVDDASVVDTDQI